MGSKLYVGNLSYDTTSSDLEQLPGKFADGVFRFRSVARPRRLPLFCFSSFRAGTPARFTYCIS